MSQANSDFGDFGDAIEYEGTPAEGMPQLSQAPSYKKKGINVYTLMLIISLICLTAGAILLFANVGSYEL